MVPWTVDNYKLDELTTSTELRGLVSKMFRRYDHIEDPRVSCFNRFSPHGERELALQSYEQRHNVPCVRSKVQRPADVACLCCMPACR